jgi:hypothetical protein
VALAEDSVSAKYSAKRFGRNHPPSDTRLDDDLVPQRERSVFRLLVTVLTELLKAVFGIQEGFSPEMVCL